MTAEQIYNLIINSVPKIKVINFCGIEYYDAESYNYFVEKYSFEERVWFYCNPDKNLANSVMELADKK